MITERKFDVGEWVVFGDEKAHESSPDRFPQVGTKGQVLATRGESALVQWPNGSTEGNGRWWANFNLLLSANIARSGDIRFMLDGCDISFIAEAPADITLRDLLKQCDKIKPLWCACGIRSLRPDELNLDTEIIIGYNSVEKATEDVDCAIKAD